MLKIHPKQNKRLNYYREQLEQIMEYYNSSKLKTDQKERLNYFVDRPINYCKTQKVIKYEKIGRNYKHCSKYSRLQKGIYKRTLADIKELQKQILDDKDLKIKHKQELCRCLSYVIGHLLGRIY